jgi:predicted DNA-binding transcriptional regulator AlpA
MDATAKALTSSTIKLWPDACNILGISRSLGYELAQRGEFPGVIRLGGCYRVSRRRLMIFVDGREQ